MSDSSLDRSILQSMFGDDEQLIADILDEFKNSSVEYSQELATAMHSRDAEGARSLAHKLKSSARNIGAIALADECEQLESRAPNHDWREIKQLADQVQILLQSVVDEITGLSG